ncbi:hypothetical protein VOLCADRAFT_94789 [Volvox carteri f. nagariensis]|uniref:Uncharacterized protein n=1 Tax=Volvox carteri f. nagariensis TaxID=3068 RepID=D8U5R9_VOLCA|nr:uncharacterized protein VOLCADRAFT_94789 [Volvox carteri f. nagariensis]EFJ45048.1 hypothetical protein VOLCADRAFT_94789 [Volvox carteri f. nagariensis]|eukprot:XP_002954019.1 hypothetical protein VOLCADRAFT_94789 [Volvox carteri f. nagariensis]
MINLRSPATTGGSGFRCLPFGGAPGGRSIRSKAYWNAASRLRLSRHLRCKIEDYTTEALRPTHRQRQRLPLPQTCAAATQRPLAPPSALPQQLQQHADESAVQRTLGEVWATGAHADTAAAALRQPLLTTPAAAATAAVAPALTCVPSSVPLTSAINSSESPNGAEYVSGVADATAMPVMLGAQAATEPSVQQLATTGAADSPPPSCMLAGDGAGGATSPFGMDALYGICSPAALDLNTPTSGSPFILSPLMRLQREDTGGLSGWLASPPSALERTNTKEAVGGAGAGASGCCLAGAHSTFSAGRFFGSMSSPAKRGGDEAGAATAGAMDTSARADAQGGRNATDDTMRPNHGQASGTQQETPAEAPLAPEDPGRDGPLANTSEAAAAATAAAAAVAVAAATPAGGNPAKDVQKEDLVQRLYSTPMHAGNAPEATAVQPKVVDNPAAAMGPAPNDDLALGREPGSDCRSPQEPAVLPSKPGPHVEDNDGAGGARSSGVAPATNAGAASAANAMELPQGKENAAGAPEACQAAPATFPGAAGMAPMLEVVQTAMSPPAAAFAVSGRYGRRARARKLQLELDVSACGRSDPEATAAAAAAAATGQEGSAAVQVPSEASPLKLNGGISTGLGIAELSQHAPQHTKVEGAGQASRRAPFRRGVRSGTRSAIAAALGPSATAEPAERMIGLGSADAGKASVEGASACLTPAAAGAATPEAGTMGIPEGNRHSVAAAAPFADAASAAGTAAAVPASGPAGSAPADPSSSAAVVPGRMGNQQSSEAADVATRRRSSKRLCLRRLKANHICERPEAEQAGTAAEILPDSTRTNSNQAQDQARQEPVRPLPTPDVSAEPLRLAPLEGPPPPQSPGALPDSELLPTMAGDPIGNPTADPAAGPLPEAHGNIGTAAGSATTVKPDVEVPGGKAPPVAKAPSAVAAPPLACKGGPPSKSEVDAQLVLPPVTRSQHAGGGPTRPIRGARAAASPTETEIEAGQDGIKPALPALRKRRRLRGCGPVDPPSRSAPVCEDPALLRTRKQKKRPNEWDLELELSREAAESRRAPTKASGPHPKATEAPASTGAARPPRPLPRTPQEMRPAPRPKPAQQKPLDGDDICGEVKEPTARGRGRDRRCLATVVGGQASTTVNGTGEEKPVDDAGNTRMMGETSSQLPLQQQVAPATAAEGVPGTEGTRPLGATIQSEEALRAQLPRAQREPLLGLDAAALAPTSDALTASHDPDRDREAEAPRCQADPAKAAYRPSSFTASGDVGVVASDHVEESNRDCGPPAGGAMLSDAALTLAAADPRVPGAGSNRAIVGGDVPTEELGRVKTANRGRRRRPPPPVTPPSPVTKNTTAAGCGVHGDELLDDDPRTSCIPPEPSDSRAAGGFGADGLPVPSHAAALPAAAALTAVKGRGGASGSSRSGGARAPHPTGLSQQPGDKAGCARRRQAGTSDQVAAAAESEDRPKRRRTCHGASNPAPITRRAAAAAAAAVDAAAAIAPGLGLHGTAAAAAAGQCFDRLEIADDTCGDAPLRRRPADAVALAGPSRTLVPAPDKEPTGLEAQGVASPANPRQTDDAGNGELPAGARAMADAAAALRLLSKKRGPRGKPVAADVHLAQYNEEGTQASARPQRRCVGRVRDVGGTRRGDVACGPGWPLLLRLMTEAEGRDVAEGVVEGLEGSTEVSGHPGRQPVAIPNVLAAAASILLTMQPGVKMYEKIFRQEFGNNPDTSKALRLLWERGHVERTGNGFRCDPYGYTVTSAGLEAAAEQRQREREAEQERLRREPARNAATGALGAGLMV